MIVLNKMRKTALSLLILSMILGVNLQGQVINKNLTIELEGFMIELTKTSMIDIETFFKQDSIVKIENEGAYVLRDNKLILSFKDKGSKDGKVDGVDISNSFIKTWHGLYVGMSYADFFSKCKIKNYSIDPDDGDKILCLIDNDLTDYALGIYFSGDFEITDSEMPESELKEMIKKNSKITLISIWNSK